MAKEIGDELIAGRKIMRPWLGIRIETLGDDPSIRDLFKGIDKGWSCGRSKLTHPLTKAICGRSTSLLKSMPNSVTTDSQLQHEILKRKSAKKLN